MDENTPRPRRSPVPPGGGMSSRLEARVAVLERTEQHQAETINEIKDEIRSGQERLAGTVDRMDTTLNTLAGQVDQLLEKRRFWQKITTGVLIAVVVALFGFIAKLSFIVQSAKLP